MFGMAIKQIRIRKFKESDSAMLAHMFEDFQDSIASTDDLHELARKVKVARSGYGMIYLKNKLMEIRRNRGIFYVAETSEEKIVGFVIAVVRELTKIDRIEQKRPMITGEITELYVDKSQRGRGLGKKLMKEAEAFLRSKRCGYARLWVFEPNRRARDFYRRIGYRDRNILMRKQL